jgi:hypothetical protein
MQIPTDIHLKAMYKVMNYVRSTKDSGNFIKPNRQWDMKDSNFLFNINGSSDSEYAADEITRRSVSGGTVFFEGVPIKTRCNQQKCVTLSVTEAETVACCDTAQDMLYAKDLVESVGLKVKVPMILKVDNKGTVDLGNSWSSTGRTRHISTRINWLRELKEQGIISVVWTSNVYMSSDIFTKNVGGADFVRHRKVYVRNNKELEEL